MKKLIVLIAVFFISTLAMAQDQIQQIDNQLFKLATQRNYNNDLFLEFAQVFTNRSEQLTRQIQQLQAQRQKLAEKPKAPEPGGK